jgi:plasmid stabilization system protein ParE
MPQNAWSPKRERQYEHIKGSLKERGANEDKAEEIAARTVNKERARSGEARQPSRTSIEDISSGRRGGLRSHTGAKGRTYAPWTPRSGSGPSPRRDGVAQPVRRCRVDAVTAET